MKNIFSFASSLCLMLCIAATSAYAQWVQCGNGLPAVGINNVSVYGNYIFAGTVSQGIYVSSDEGNSWTPKNNGLTDSCVITFGYSGSTIFAGTRSNGIFRSSDNGESWTAKNNGLTSSSVWSFATTGNHIFAATRDSGIYHSTNNGENWMLIRKDLIYIRTLVTDGDSLYAGTFNTGVHLTTDFGATWSERNNELWDIDVRILALKGNDMFAGTSALGIFHTTNGGLIWHNETIGISTYGSVWAIAFFGNSMILGSYDRGIYTSSDTGTTWTEKNQGLTDSSVTRLAVSSEYIFAVTGNELFKAKISELISDVDETAMKAEFSILPNPATDYIEIPIGAQGSVPNIRIFNIFGEIVKNPTPTLPKGEGIRIVVSGLPSGAYFVRIGGKIGKFLKI